MTLLPTVEFSLRMLLGSWIVVSGALKVIDLYGFVRIIKGLKLLPKKVGGPFAVLYAFSEVIAGLALILNTLVIPALIIVGVKQSVSLIGVILLLVRRQEVTTCGCYGTFLPSPLGVRRIVENVLILMLSVLLLVG